MINLLYLAIQVSKEKRKNTGIQILYIIELVTCAFTISAREEHNISEMGSPGPVKSKRDYTVWTRTQVATVQWLIMEGTVETGFGREEMRTLSNFSFNSRSKRERKQEK